MAEHVIKSNGTIQHPMDCRLDECPILAERTEAARTITALRAERDEDAQIIARLTRVVAAFEKHVGEESANVIAAAALGGDDG